MTKTIPWTRIKAEYLQGVTPQGLAKKYKLTVKQLSDKAYRDKWKDERAKIYEKTRENIQDKIQKYSNEAIEVLREVMKAPESKNLDKVSAAKALLDISGLKSSKQEITGANGEPFTIQKEYILPEEIKQFEEHYKNTVGE